MMNEQREEPMWDDAIPRNIISNTLGKTREVHAYARRDR
jgi:hypothetical protein